MPLPQRLLCPYLNDAISLGKAGSVFTDEVDAARKATGLSMSPFEVLDVVSNDVSLAIQRELPRSTASQSRTQPADWPPSMISTASLTNGRLVREQQVTGAAISAAVRCGSRH
jgi:3-hydroxyacyl-CoA dehydrogenase